MLIADTNSEGIRLGLNDAQPEPSVLCIVPVHNGEQFLGETLESLRRQDYERLQILVVDDNSKDSSDRIVRQSNLARLTHVRRTFISGPHASRNLAHQGFDVDYIAYLDHDDVANATWISHSVSQVMSRKLDVFCASAVTIDENSCAIGEWSTPLEHSEFVATLPFRCPIVLSGAVVSRLALVEVGGFRNELGMSADFDLWLRLAERGAVFGGSVTSLISFRVHDKSWSATQALRGRVAKVDALHRAYLRSAGLDDTFSWCRKRASPIEGMAAKDANAQVAVNQIQKLFAENYSDSELHTLCDGAVAYLSHKLTESGWPNSSSR